MATENTDYELALLDEIGELAGEVARLRAALIDLATIAVESDPVIAARVSPDTGRVIEECVWAAALEKETPQ